MRASRCRPASLRSRRAPGDEDRSIEARGAMARQPLRRAHDLRDRRHRPRRSSASPSTSAIGDGAQKLPLGLTSTVESARAVLSTVAGATITVAGIAFSVSLLTIQLASSQYSPRVVSGLFRDPFNKRVIGLVVGTFAYCLVVLRSVRSALEQQGQSVVPNVSVAVGVLLGVASILAIVAFINHNAHTMDISEILDGVTVDAIEAVDRHWSANLFEPSPVQQPTSCPTDRAWRSPSTTTAGCSSSTTPASWPWSPQAAPFGSTPQWAGTWSAAHRCAPSGRYRTTPTRPLEHGPRRDPRRRDPHVAARRVLRRAPARRRRAESALAGSQRSDDRPGCDLPHQPQSCERSWNSSHRHAMSVTTTAGSCWPRHHGHEDLVALAYDEIRTRGCLATVRLRSTCSRASPCWRFARTIPAAARGGSAGSARSPGHGGRGARGPLASTTSSGSGGSTTSTFLPDPGRRDEPGLEPDGLA